MTSVEERLRSKEIATKPAFRRGPVMIVVQQGEVVGGYCTYRIDAVSDTAEEDDHRDNMRLQT